ncbi:DUF2058 domain-containing protein [Arenicella xantha]|uniref:Nucleoprotein/polynucleotide-associated enzyme n=1 Tax=Arenicella xantha TaxID=644221 RepID=A0A395JHG8_9GAMM|nr:DUF2058 domain-containing protein [Arenicella xantha]RBP47079.1 hypothetical protein DFR28_11042 [Arenicella xantha]
MSTSLKDQLLKAGLVKKKDVQKTAKKKAPSVPKKARNKASEATLRAQRAMLDKAKKDKALNEKRKAEAERKARYAQIKQLVDGGKLDRKKGETAFNFPFKKKIKTIYVTDEQHKLLSKQQVTIISMDNELFEIVPKKVAEQVAKREPQRIINISSSSDTPSANDPYADYEIPDDLIW